MIHHCPLLISSIRRCDGISNVSTMSNYSTGTSVITSEKEVTIDYVVDEATKIFSIVRARGLRAGDSEGSDALMAEIRQSNREFCTSYPIVLRYMCQMGRFSPRALRLYLRKIAMHPWKTESEYLDSQTDYVCLLYQCTAKRWNRAEVANIRTNVRRTLEQETVLFKKYVTEFDKEVTTGAEIASGRNLDALRDFVATQVKGEVCLSVQSDIVGGQLDFDSLVAGVSAEDESAGNGNNADDLLA